MENYVCFPCRRLIQHLSRYRSVVCWSSTTQWGCHRAGLAVSIYKQGYKAGGFAPSWRLAVTRFTSLATAVADATIFFLIFGAHNSNDWHTWLLTNNRKPSYLTSTVISTKTRLCDSDAFNSRDRMEQGLEPASASLNIGLADREL